ncbi:hypothetical protein [Pedobacter xixiisoli]|uniref:Outer membrane protein beta-barrel domain-containing protein n=1 Tax=Pedobacter xixiisoli TaxID=1476464 RepID=A0A286AD85_9SPHI|nr:hypothetical protein [Pedobacter xixiisoli]SOD19864.1 hypothetical protein SAMN06297358_3571 [Pedobacter xixiisoli]
MTLSKKLLCCLFIIGSLKSFAQSTAKNEKVKWGFFLKSNVNFFQINEPTIDVKTDLGFGFGNVFSINLNKSLGIALEPHLNFERHTLTHIPSNSTLKLKDNSFAVPLKLSVKLYQELSLIAGAEYLYVLSKQNEEFKLQKNNYLALAGVSYAIKFKHFTMVPELSYRLGLGNALAESPLHDYELKRSSVSFGIKVM